MGVTLAWVIDTEYYFSEGILVILHKTLNAFMDTWAYLSMYIQSLTSYFVRSIKIARKHTQDLHKTQHNTKSCQYQPESYKPMNATQQK